MRFLANARSCCLVLLFVVLSFCPVAAQMGRHGPDTPRFIFDAIVNSKTLALGADPESKSYRKVISYTGFYLLQCLEDRCEKYRSEDIEIFKYPAISSGALSLNVTSQMLSYQSEQIEFWLKILCEKTMCQKRLGYI